MTNMVCGFLIDDQRERVLLQRKRKPAWQAGWWNGVGGHIELSESPVDAMQREAKEECRLPRGDWRHFVSLVDPAGIIVHFFYWFLPKAEFVKRTSDARVYASEHDLEPLCVMSLRELVTEPNVIRNLRWLVPLALDRDRGGPILVETAGAPWRNTTMEPRSEHGE